MLGTTERRWIRWRVREMACVASALAAAFGVASCGQQPEASARGVARVAAAGDENGVTARVAARRAAITGGVIALPEAAWPDGGFACAGSKNANSHSESRGTVDSESRLQGELDRLRSADAVYAAALKDSADDDALLVDRGLVIRELCDGWPAYMGIEPVGEKVLFYRDVQRTLPAGWVSVDIMHEEIAYLAARASHLSADPG